MKNTSKKVHILTPQSNKTASNYSIHFFLVIKHTKKINKFFVWFSYILQSELREISAEKENTKKFFLLKS